MSLTVSNRELDHEPNREPLTDSYKTSVCFLVFFFLIFYIKQITFLPIADHSKVESLHTAALNCTTVL